MRLFVLASASDLGERIVRELGLERALHEERDFQDGEHKSRPLVSVRGRDVFVVQSLHGDARQSVNDKLCRLLFFIAALRDGGAERVTAVVPYLCYARKDRQTKPRDPVTTRYVALAFEAMGTDCVVTLDVHNLAAYQNAFRCACEHLEARLLFIDVLAPRLEGQNVVIASPDTGGTKRADRFRIAMEQRLGGSIPSIFMEKHRSGGVVTGETLVGDVAGRTVVIVDDLVSSGGTLVRTARACREQGAHRVYAVASHGLFTSDASAVFTDSTIDELFVTNSIPQPRRGADSWRDRVTVVDSAPLFAQAIARMHRNESLTELLTVPLDDPALQADVRPTPSAPHRTR